MHALCMLTIPIRILEQFGCNSEARTMQAALLNSCKHKLLRQQLELDDKYAVVTPKSLCQICRKRLGTQAALLTPEMKLVHDRCHQEEVTKVERRPFPHVFHVGPFE